MKLFFCLLSVLILTCSPAIADWSQTFRTTYEEKGIDTAVSAALGEGAAPNLIIQYGITIKGLSTSELIKALFCSLVQPAVIYEAAAANHITESTVAEGYQMALAQCAAEMEEQANAAPGAPFPGTPPAGQGRPAQASPWNFN